MKPFYKHMALGFRSTRTHNDMSVNKEFRIKEYENMNGTAVNNRLVTAIDTQE